MWYDCQCDRLSLDTKQQTIKLLQATLQFSMMGKTHTIKQDVKSPKTNEVKLIIEVENQPNLYRNYKEHKKKKQQPLDCRLLAWDRHIKYMAGLNLYLSTQPSPILGLSWENTTIK